MGEEAATGVADPGRRRRPGGPGWPTIVAARRLLREAETAAFWLVLAPALALLPASIAYRAACWRGDWTYWSWPEKRHQVLRGLRAVLGDELGEREAKRVTRDIFRIRTCEIIDLMLLRGRARGMKKLVEIRGREHLDAALADGKGALLCGAHFGSYMSGFSLLHASGIPVTSIGRWWWKYPPGGSSAVRRMWDWVYARRVLRYRQRPSIEPWPGRVQVALQAAAALRGNEAVTILSDAPPLDAEMPRAVEVPFLGGRVKFLSGVVDLARLTGAPILMVSVYRTAGYRRQVLEISPAVSMEGDTATVFGRCVTAMETAIREHPAEWDFWFEPGDLVRLGLVPANTTDPASQAGDFPDRLGELQQSSR